jgi:undecaprenol kinase
MKMFLVSFRYALQGIRFAWQGRNFRIQCFIALIVIVTGAWTKLSFTEWMIVFLLIGLVLSFEIFNSAIESIVNFVSPEFHPLAGKIKDLAAGAVLVMSIAAAIIGLIIFVPHFLGF